MTTVYPYRDLNSYFKHLFGCRVHKIAIDAGLNCPNRDGHIATGGCIYCNPKGSGTGALARGISIADQIQTGQQAIRKRFKAKKFMAYFQSFTNTYAPVAQLKAIYDQALAAPDMVGMAVGTRPDCVAPPVLDLLQDYTRQYLVWIEYGLQSAHDATLRRINRGHDFACFKRAAVATAERGMHVCAHVILGLPGENRAQMIETARAIADLGIDGIKLHLLYVAENTPLARIYRQGGYRCLEQREYVDLVCDFIERLPPSVIIQRLTGDPHWRELIAPRWSLRKDHTLNMIRQTFQDRRTRQGSRFDKP